MADYSNKDFTGQDLSNRDDMDGLTIEGSCFSHEKPNSECFPSNLSGVIFRNCNLDNCKIPDGNVLENCSHRFFQAQEDSQDWELDPATLQPIKILGT